MALRITPAALVSILDEEFSQAANSTIWSVRLRGKKWTSREASRVGLLRDHPLQRVRSYRVRDAERSWRHSSSVSWKRSGALLGSWTRGRQAPRWPCAPSDCPCGCSSMCADPSPVGPDPAKDDPSKNRCIGGETRCGTFRWYGSPPFATKKSKAQAMAALIRPKRLRSHLGRRDRSHE